MLGALREEDVNPRQGVGSCDPTWRSLSVRVLERKAMKRFHLALGVSDVETFPPSVM